MEQTELDQMRRQFDQQVRERFPNAPIERAELLQYGDDPEVEPGHFLARVVVAASGDDEERARTFEAFHSEYRAAFRELRRDLDKLPVRAVLKFTAGGEQGRGKTLVLQLAPDRAGPGPDGPAQTPVMARLGAEDLETLDTLITVGIASSRADAVRWALARIRERPAYDQLRARTREIEELKSQF
jgi:hypothetical protein